MTRDRGTETLAQLAADGVERVTYRAFEVDAVDPETGYRPSKSTLWKISHHQDVRITPALVRAVAAGLGLDPQRVAAAAARQYTGLVIGDPFGGTYGSGVGVVRRPGVAPEDMHAEKAILEQWRNDDAQEADD